MTPVSYGSLLMGYCSAFNIFFPLPQEELVNSAAFRYITDAITREEALEMLKAKEATKKEREAKVRELG